MTEPKLEGLESLIVRYKHESGLVLKDGDILNCGEGLIIIQWAEEYKRFVAVDLDTGNTYLDLHKLLSVFEVKVIGNFYENPEFINDAKETKSAEGVSKVLKLSELVKMFVDRDIDDLELQKEKDQITIGYFHYCPTWVARINNGILSETLFSRWEKTEWLFELIDKKTEIIDDYFDEIDGIKLNEEVLGKIK